MKKNTIVDKSLDSIIIFCQSVTIRQLREKYIRKIVHFKRLGSRCFYDLFQRCYFFFLNHYAFSKTKPQDIWG